MLIANTIAVVIPSYKVKSHILDVIASIGKECSSIYVVDDCCPEKSGEFVRQHCNDNRVKVIFNPKNTGVGGAVLAGYTAAIKDGATIIVKIDGDGQMDPSLLPKFIAPILNGYADYTKGNRFYDIRYISRMPFMRIMGNLSLSFMTKLSSGYWNIFDPTNGYTAIHAKIAEKLPLEKISHRYFFETDMLFRLNTFRAMVVDIPMDAKYGDEKSNLKIYRILGEFLFKNIRNGFKRILYNYFLRDFTLASLELLIGSLLFIFGFFWGIYKWWHNSHLGIVTPTGTIMLSVLPIIIGIQLILGFLAYDISNTPKEAQHKLM
ncbi:MAG: glycosyltransferase family 2 protein [Bacteroidetes bacterium]|nr:glycosyltransferase family 2 protein [Bacteroidota bacterium]